MASQDGQSDDEALMDEVLGLSGAREPSFIDCASIVTSSMNTSGSRTIPSFSAVEGSEMTIVSHKTRIRVFRGGIDCQQYEPFIAAKGEFVDRIEVECITVKEVKKARMTEKQFIDWLKNCDAHIFLGHPHQGIIFHLGWAADVLAAELLRLQDHPGFPTGIALMCPIFLQNKLLYLKYIDVYANNTYPIALNDDYVRTEEFAAHVSQ